MAMPDGPVPTAKVPSTAPLGLNFVTVLLPPFTTHTLPEASMAMPDGLVPTGAVIVRLVLPDILPEVAVIVAEPTETPVARPLLLTVATDVFDDVQVTCAVKSCFVPSEYEPVAEHCRVAPTFIYMRGFPGFTGYGVAAVRVMETSVGVEILPPPPQECRKDKATKKKITNKRIIFVLLFLFPMTSAPSMMQSNPISQLLLK